MTSPNLELETDRKIKHYFSHFPAQHSHDRGRGVLEAWRRGFLNDPVVCVGGYNMSGRGYNYLSSLLRCSVNESYNTSRSSQRDVRIDVGNLDRLGEGGS